MKTIMIVDDEQLFHDFFSEMLDGINYEVISAYDGDEALSKIEEKEPELIITDDLIFLEIISNKGTGDTPSLYTKSTTEFGDIPLIIISDFLLRSFRDQRKIGPSFAFPDKTFIREKLLDEVNTKIEQKITLCS
ncbi:MAG: response regulator [Candidatus Scalindua sp.]